MIKVIRTGSFDFGMPVAQLVDVHCRGIDSCWREKRAAVLTDIIRDIRPEPGHSYIHLISLGAGESYGANRNGDYFNEKRAYYDLFDPKPNTSPRIQLSGGLIEFHPTFEKYAHVFKHHNNKDPKGKIGDVKAAAYNPDMRRGELIIKVPHNKEWNDDLQKLAQGKDIPFSMACKVAYDICSACGNRARTRGDYCDHLKDHMTEIVKSGHQICAINDVPNFFDISKVFKPADRIAWSLQKVAFDLAPMGGAELAEMMEVSAPSAIPDFGGGPANFVRKMAAARKLAAIEKMVEGTAQGNDNMHLKHLALGCPAKCLDDSEIDTLRQGDLAGVLKSLSDARILLSVDDFLRLVMGSKESITGNTAQVKQLLPGMFGRLLDSGEADGCAADESYDGDGTSIPRLVRDLIERTVGDRSLSHGPAQNRIRIMIIRGASPRNIEQSPMKLAAVSKQAEVLAKEYAKYQLSFVTGVGDDELTSDLTVLSNYSRTEGL